RAPEVRRKEDKAMLVLGLSGGPDLVNENLFNVPRSFMHDAAAVLVEDGEVLYAIEEERLNRIKHTNKMPVAAVRACLEHRGLRPQDVDAFAFYSVKEAVDLWIKEGFLADAKMPELVDPAVYLQRLYSRGLGCELEPSRFHFIHHHLAHAASAFYLSGFERALVTTFDGHGDGSSGMILTGEGTRVTPVINLPKAKSLGLFYDKVIAYLGYKIFDEYKVMGLAPYGDPEKYRRLFRTFYTLLPEGRFEIHEHNIFSLFSLGPPRRKWEPFSQTHKDVAAALQESLEELAFHVLRHYREKTGQQNLCMAGGVAHNCTLNGKVLRSGLFENVFVQPASHDAGTALGAALWVYYQARPGARRPPQMKHVYWGTEAGGGGEVFALLSRWGEFLEIERTDDAPARAARLIAGGSVVGWVQGRSEFGPRALGNRSILADPRPAENKDRINQMVKKREGYRPFAPSVLEEEVGAFFEVKEGERHPFMVFVVNVREEKRELLGAVTHVDGTARIQTVARETNEKYWRLIRAFQELTGVPVVLNTSFNNNVEPIVDSVEDAVASFLTTRIDHLVVGDYLVTKKAVPPSQLLSLKVSLPPYVSLHQVRKTDADGRPQTTAHIETSFDPSAQQAVSPGVARILEFAGEGKRAREILEEAGATTEEAARVVEELWELWSSRLIACSP
ncbi:MAG: nodulation protein, partial [Acidobacteriota bacterium]|nr:nodulation protein [Acidobacteriota bacterium]